MRRAVLTVLAVLGVAAALSVTASSTAQQAHAAGMVGLPVAGLVVLLEVVNVVGAWAAITDTRTHVRVEALVGVAAASAVTAICGALTYHALGVVAPVGLLMAVHGVSRMWTTAAPAKGAKVEPPPVSAPLSPPEPPTEVEPAPLPPPSAPVGDVAPPPPTVAPSAPAEPISAPGAGDDEITAWIAAQASAHGRLPGRDAVRREWSCGAKRAQRLLDEHADRPLLTAIGES